MGKIKMSLTRDSLDLGDPAVRRKLRRLAEQETRDEQRRRLARRSESLRVRATPSSGSK